MSDDLKPLFRSLLRKYHPDVTTDLSKKDIFAELTRSIIVAYEARDGETLREIERLGLAYRAPCKARVAEVVEMPTQDEVRPTRARPSRKWRSRFLWTFCCPYALAFMVQNWNENGKSRNATCIVGALFWGWLGTRIWEGSDVLGDWLANNGYPHESIVGLGVVLLRGLILLLLLPIAIPLGIVALRMGWLAVSVWVAHWFLSGLLGFFHPYLSWVATIGLGAALAVALWRSLDEW